MDKKPYQLSVWGDKSVYIVSNGTERREIDSSDLNKLKDNENVVNHTFKEVQLCRISSDEMDTPIRAFDLKLVQNLNGSNQLSFKMFYRYYDEEKQDYQENPFLKLLTNERKIKLFYNNEWYHFLIKQIDENSSNYTFSYVCVDQYINELSKNGYEILLDEELENNIGTAPDLGEYILEGTDWFLNKDRCSTLKEKNIETLCTYKLKKSINPINTLTGILVGKAIKMGEVIWICYSDILDKKTKEYQFFYNWDKKEGHPEFETDTDGVIVNSLNLSIAKTELEELDLNPESETKNCSVDSRFLGNKYVQNQSIKYIPEIKQYCAEWKKENDRTRYYSFKEMVTASESELQEIILNNENFTSSMGWTGVTDSETNKTSIVTLGLTDTSPFKNTIDVNFNGSKYVNNDGFYSNRKMFDGLTKGQSFIFAIKCATPEENKKITNGILKGKNKETGIWTDFTKLDNSFLANLQNKLWFSSLQKDGYKIFKLDVENGISYREMLNNMLYFYIEGSGKIQILSTKLFKFIIGADKKPLVPDSTEINGTVRNQYTFFSDAELKDGEGSITSKDELKPLKIYDNIEKIEEDGYLPVYGKVGRRFEKVGTIKGSKSNRFNLIQEICEVFGCWAKFEINTFENGEPSFLYQLTLDTKFDPNKIYYEKISEESGKYGEFSNDINFDEYTGSAIDFITQKPTLYERKMNKEVYFREFIGRDHQLGFRYGINLKGIQRKIDSQQTVSKTIVQPNNNEFAENGSCTIQRAVMNPSGETAIYNFSYYIQNKLLNRVDVNRDLYGSDTGGLGYYPKLYSINTHVTPLIDQATMISKTLTSLLSKQQVYSALVSENQVKLQEYITDIANALNISIEEATNLSYNEQVHNDTIKKYIIMRDSALNTSQNYTQKGQDLKILISKYQGDYKRVKNVLGLYKQKKQALVQKFFIKYSRYIQEGTWISEDHVDDDLYYMDAVGLSRTSAFPKVSYQISVIDISGAEECEAYSFNIGDKSYIEDTEFFGWQENGRPYQEEIIISQVTHDLDDPSKDTITVQNYKTQFEDLFQRITAQTTSLQYHEGEYRRAGDAINADGTINSEFLKNSLSKNVGFIQGAPNGELVIDQDKGTITMSSVKGDILLNSLGILIGSDGHYSTAISSEGINATVITTGRLNAGQVAIYADDQETFLWDSYGLTAYGLDTDPDGKITAVHHTDGVRMDRFGFYGYKGKATNFRPKTVTEVRNNSIFSLTQKGLLININETASEPVIKIGDNKFNVYSDGRVTITTSKAVGDTTKNEVFNINKKFKVYDNGDVEASSGTFTGTIKADDIQIKTEIGYKSILEGTKIKNNYLDLGNIKLNGTNGTITMTGNNQKGGIVIDGATGSIKLTGSINWGTNKPVQYQFSTDGINWHEIMGSEDKYRRDKIGDQEWGAGYQFRGTDGKNGIDGSDGAPASDQSIIDLMAKNGINVGLATQGITQINDASIYSANIYGGTIYAIGSSPTTNSSYLTLSEDGISYYTPKASYFWSMGYNKQEKTLYLSAADAAININCEYSIKLEPGVQGIQVNQQVYGSSLPSSGHTGQIFFLI